MIDIHPIRARWRNPRWALAAGLIVTTVAITGVFASTYSGSPKNTTGPTTAPPPSAPTSVSLPRQLRIPAIGVDASVGTLGLNNDGTVQVPANPLNVGWYRLGPSPGQPGSAVLLGHVDSLTGPAVFYQLRNVPIGAHIQVDLTDGHTVRFVVEKVATYPVRNFPAAAIYRNHGPVTLTLVTCGGTYNKSRGGYQSNVVVTARPAQP